VISRCVSLHAERLERDDVWCRTDAFLHRFGAKGRPRHRVRPPPLRDRGRRGAPPADRRPARSRARDRTTHALLRGGRRGRETADRSLARERPAMPRSRSSLSHRCRCGSAGFVAGAWAIVGEVTPWLRDHGFTYDASVRAFPLSYDSGAAAPGDGWTAARIEQAIVCLPTTAPVSRAVRGHAPRAQVADTDYELLYLHDYDLMRARTRAAAVGLFLTSRRARWTTAGALAALATKERARHERGSPRQVRPTRSSYTSRYADPDAIARFYVDLVATWGPPGRSARPSWSSDVADGFMTEALLRAGFVVTALDLSPGYDRRGETTCGRRRRGRVPRRRRGNVRSVGRTWDVVLGAMWTSSPTSPIPNQCWSDSGAPRVRSSSSTATRERIRWETSTTPSSARGSQRPEVRPVTVPALASVDAARPGGRTGRLGRRARLEVARAPEAQRCPHGRAGQTLGTDREPAELQPEPRKPMRRPWRPTRSPGTEETLACFAWSHG
jgi:hypothetical protein